MHCQLQPADDTLEANAVLPRDPSVGFGQSCYIFTKVTGSTNDDVRARIAAGTALHGTVVVADAQTAGRGRHARNWHSPAGSGIYASLLLYPQRPLQEAPLLGIAAAVAATQAIQKTTGATAQIKWPNDILLNGNKIAGILAETDLRSDDSYAVIIGLGMNVNTNPADLPHRPQFPASSIKAELGRDTTRAPLLATWLREMQACYALWQQGEHATILDMWRDVAYGLHKTVTIQQHDSQIQGILHGIAPDGALILIEQNAQTRRILSGDLLPITRL